MASKKKVIKKADKKKPVAKKKAPAKKATKAVAKKKTVTKKRVVAIKGRASKKPARTAKRTVTKRARPTKVVAVVVENDEGRKLANMIAAAALEKKATEVVVLDVRRNAPSVGYDYIVIATGDSQPQLSAMSEAVRLHGKTINRRPLIEESPEWVLMNFDDVMVHFFTPEKRQLYDLDGLWSDVPRHEVRA